MHETGYIRDPHSEADWLYGAIAPAPASLPVRLSYESLLGPALNQGGTFECVCYAIAGLKRFHEFKQSGAWLDFDPHDLYSLCKERDGHPGVNGTLPRVAMDVLREIGMLGSTGERFKVSATARQTNVENLKAAIVDQGPVLIGLRIDPAEFAALSSTAMIGAEHSDHFTGHAMLIVGYDDEIKAFRIRNSWGPTWGDNGHLWLSYEYLIRVDPQFDAWSTIDA